MDLGFKQGASVGLALEYAQRKLEEEKWEVIQKKLKAVLESPTNFFEDKDLGRLAESLTEPVDEIIDLREERLPYTIYGEEEIEEGAIKQIETAMQLPVALAGALMADAHQGYGLPIGWSSGY